jgi:hypothetical protein
MLCLCMVTMAVTLAYQQQCANLLCAQLCAMRMHWLQLATPLLFDCHGLHSRDLRFLRWACLCRDVQCFVWCLLPGTESTTFQHSLGAVTRILVRRQPCVPLPDSVGCNLHALLSWVCMRAACSSHAGHDAVKLFNLLYCWLT